MDPRRRRRLHRTVLCTSVVVVVVALVVITQLHGGRSRRSAATVQAERGAGRPTSGAGAPAETAPTYTTEPSTADTRKTDSTTAPPATGQATTTVQAASSLPKPGPPYRVASTTLPLVDTTRPTVSGGRRVAATRSLTTLVWTPVAPGRWPLVIFAHGFEVGPTPYAALLQSWAAAGFVVAAPEFPLTDSGIAGGNLDESDIDNQPADVRFVIDQLAAPSSPVAGAINPLRVAVAGHSDGAETALAASVQTTPSGEPPIQAVIAMSVSPLPDTTRTANPPLLVTQGDSDDINPPGDGYQTWESGASPKYLAVLLGAGHLPPLQDGSAWLPDIERVTIDFLRAYLSGDSTAAITHDGAIDPLRMTVRSG